MDHISLSGRGAMVDLESGGTTNEGGGSPDPVLGRKLAQMFFTKVCDGFVSFDESSKCVNGLNLESSVFKSSKASPKKVKLLIDKKVEGKETPDLAETKTGKDKRKSTSAKKPPKPPRPPRGLSLDAADQMLIKEIAELAMLKRARIERMKALKKMKEAKASSSYGNLFAMLFTMLFCLVIIFQGMSSKSTTPMSFHGSPESAGAADGGFILVQEHLNPSASDTNIPSSGSPNLSEQVSGSDPEGTVRRAVG